MSVNKIIYKGRSKYAMPILNREEYMQLRASHYLKETLRKIREEGLQQLKSQLPQINYSGYYPNGAVKGNKLPSKAFGFDIDDKAEFERITPMLLADPDKYGLLMLERSVNGGGHAVLRREPGKTILENQVRIAILLNCEMDTNAHDINRVFYTTAVDDLLFLSEDLFTDTYVKDEAEAEARTLEDRERFGNEEVPAEAHKAEKHFRPGSPLGVTGVKELQELPPIRSVTALHSGLESKLSDAPLKPLQTNVLGATKTIETTETASLDYLGIPYSEIIKKWWDLYNDGQTPVQSNRDTLTYELAVNIRHICGFDRELMDKVIPCYDGFSYEQKMKCIDSALSERRTQMPRRMRELLDTFRLQSGGNSELSERLSAVLEGEETYVNDNIKCLPQGIRDSISGTGPTLAMPAILSAASCIGALATGVRLDVHGKSSGLNFITFVAGQAGSGKGAIGPVIKAWMHEIKEADKVYLQQEEEYRRKKREAKNKKDQPQEDKFPIRYLTLNNTAANIAERLKNTEGQHAFSFTSEADEVASKWSSAMNDFSTLLRKAYDNDEFYREAKSAEAVNAHIEEVFWNVVMCGTPGALFRVVRNYEDGFQSRIALASTPDNTFAPLADTPYLLTDEAADNIRQIAHLLPLCAGYLVLPELEKVGRAWLERVRMKALENYDEILARQRMRVCITTQRLVCCLMLCSMLEKLIKKMGTVEKAETYLKGSPEKWKALIAKEQTPEMLSNFDLLADTMLDTNLFYFKTQLTNTQAETSAIISTIDMVDGRKSVKNATIFNKLPKTFKFADATAQSRAIKGSSIASNTIAMMLNRWRKQGLVTYNPETKVYTKV